MGGKPLKAEPYEIQHVAILDLTEDWGKPLYKIWPNLVRWKFVDHMMKNKEVVIAVELAFYKVSLTKEMHYHCQLLLAGSVQVLVCFQLDILFLKI